MTSQQNGHSSETLASTRTLVLMYHAVLTSHGEWASQPSADRWYAILADQFQEQVEYLARKGYGTASLDDLFEGKSGLRSVVLTFDDGHESNHRVALPILQRFGFVAEFFVTVANIGKPGFMNWEQLKELAAAGMSVQSHGLNHRAMTRLNNNELQQEFRESKELLEKKLGKPVRYFAIPGGFANDEVYRAGFASGYKAICNSEPGLAKVDKVLQRIAVMHSTSLDAFDELVQRRFLRLFRMTAQRELGKAAKALMGVDRYEALKRRALKG